MKVSQLNRFLFFKLPSAYFCGVRVSSFQKERVVVKVAYRWINSNPFKSMFWAVQGMAAELSTGVMVMSEIKKSGSEFSMLVTENKAAFYKKAKGKIYFECTDYKVVEQAFAKAKVQKEGERFWMSSEGRDSEGNLVSRFEFQWSILQRGL